MAFSEPMSVDDEIAVEAPPAPFAGTGRRLGGAIIDFSVVGTGVALFDQPDWFGPYASLLVSIGFLLYFTLSYVGPFQATLGQRLFGVHVTDKAGERITFRRAFWRYSSLAAFVPFGSPLAYTFGDGIADQVFAIYSLVAALVCYAPALVTREKTAFHDLMSRTRVRVGRL
jgi:uncharacterized RDD family membrane protein YckC